MSDWFMTNIGDPVVETLTAILIWLHDLVEPALGVHSWGWAIVILTLIVRVALLPLAIKQTRSMRAMQKLQPQMKELQKKYKVDRSLLKQDPEKYKAKKQKLNEEMMALYQREGANPAASCLPLLAQAPIFIALFWTLRRADELSGQPFYFFTSVGEGGLEQIVRSSGWPGWLLIVLMAGTMFFAQKQMMSRNPMAAEGPMAQQQKIMLYAMPGFLAFISLNFPMGILLYWVTTNFWQVAQQAIIFREVKHEFEKEQRSDGGSLSKSATSGDGPATSGTSTGAGKGATSGKAAKGGGKKGSEGGGDRKSGGKKGSEGGGAPKGASSGKKGAPSGKRPSTGQDAPGASNGEARTGGKRSGSGNGARSGAKGKRDHIPRRSGG